MSNFIDNITFIQRTKSIIENYNGEFDVSLIINSCVGLLFMAKEKYHSTISRAKSEKSLAEWGINISDIKFCGKYDHKRQQVIIQDKRISTVCSHIRNSIAHCNFKTLQKGTQGDIKQLLLRDFYIPSNRNKEPIMTFEMVISVEDFRKFIMSVADYILKKHKS